MPVAADVEIVGKNSKLGLEGEQCPVRGSRMTARQRIRNVVVPERELTAKSDVIRSSSTFHYYTAMLIN